MADNPTAVVGRRVVAFLIDAAIAALIVALLWIALTDRLDADTTTGGGFVIGDTRYGFADTSGDKRAAWFVLSGLVIVGLFAVLPGLRGVSPGRALLGIRVVGRDGRPPGVGRSFARSGIGLVVDGFPWLVPGLVGLIVSAATGRHQKVGELVSSSYTIRAGAMGRPVDAQVAPQPGHPPGWYDDPYRQNRLRWWDGAAWTDHTSA